MNTIISSLALATILSTPLAASAAQTPAQTKVAPAPTMVAMSQHVTTPDVKRADDRQAILRVEMESRQLGPTN